MILLILGVITFHCRRSDVKDHTGSVIGDPRKTAPHLKVEPYVNGESNPHERLIRIEHCDAAGSKWPYEIKKTKRGPNYDYTTLVKKNGPRSDWPREEQVRAAAAAAAA